MEKNKFVCKCHQLTMLLIVPFFLKASFEEKNQGNHIDLPDLIMH